MFHFLLIAKHIKDGTLTLKDVLDTTLFTLIVFTPIIAYYSFGIDQMFIHLILQDAISNYSSSVLMLLGMTPICTVYILALSIYNTATKKKTPQTGNGENGR